MRKIISFLITLLTVSNLQSQQQVPKLVVFITVDQLRADYINYFYHTFGERGFKRLINQGVVYPNVRFDFSPIDQANAYATIFTGSNPNNHGVARKMTYSFDLLKEVSCLYDSRFLGNFTRENYSPNNLLSSTIGDELKKASKGRSDVYTIALDAEEAILSGGKKANSVFWLNNSNGKWATTTYYKDIPWYVEKYNNSPESLPTRMKTLVWQPSLPISSYNAFPYILEESSFQHNFKANTHNSFSRLKTSPYGNHEVNRLVSQFLEYGTLGKRPCPDMLSISYYAGNYSGNRTHEYTREIQDLYYQLDKTIEELLDLLEKKVGLNNSLIVFTGTGYFMTEEVLDKEEIGQYEFHPKRCLSLLNMYLMAIYGQKNWIKGYYNNQIYLNRKTIEEEKIDLSEFQNKAADFITEFSGVERVTTDMSLRAGKWNQEMSDLYYGSYHKGRGDLIIRLQPRWRVVLEDEDVSKAPVVSRNNAVQTPFILFGNGIQPQTIGREINATEIAPTVTHILRIRPPNACKQSPLFEITKLK